MAKQDKTGQNVVVTNDAERNAYLIKYEGSDDALGLAAYLDNGQERIFYHTEVSPEYQGRGLANLLVEDGIADTVAGDYQVVASCPLVRGWMEKHPEYEGKWRKPNMDDMNFLRSQLF